MPSYELSSIDENVISNMHLLEHASPPMKEGQSHLHPNLSPYRSIDFEASSLILSSTS